jgi:hypothetical protein
VVPQPLEHRPRLAEAVGGIGAHLHPLGHAPVELGLDERDDIDAVDHQIAELAIDVDVEQFDAAHPYVLQPDEAKLRPGEVNVADEGVVEVDLVEGGTPQAHPLEARPVQVLLAKLGHGTGP